MTADDRNDDPTRALDDFVLRMRPPAASSEGAPDLSEFSARLNADGPARHRPDAPAPAKARGGVLRSGQRWNVDDVEDVPLVEVPRVRPLPTDIPLVTLPIVDLQAEEALTALAPEVDWPAVAPDTAPDGTEGQDATEEANRFAASQFNAETLDARLPVWQPDPRALRPRPLQDPRLLSQWQPGAWIGAVRQILEASTEFVTTAQGPAIETHAPQHLLLLWPPQRMDAPLLGRWPQQVRLWAGSPGEPDATAVQALLATLPADANLWLQPDAEAVDWALGAEILLVHEAGLRPAQIEGLRQFIGAEREASFAQLNDAYQRPDGPHVVLRR